MYTSDVVEKLVSQWNKTGLLDNMASDLAKEKMSILLDNTACDLVELKEKYSSNYLALGSGEDVAHGSLQSTEALKLHTGERIVQALKAAESNTNFVRAPFYVESI